MNELLGCKPNYSPEVIPLFVFKLLFYCCIFRRDAFVDSEDEYERFLNVDIFSCGILLMRTLRDFWGESWH